MKYIIIYISLLTSLYSQNIEMNLKQFAELVSSQHLVNIIIDDTIEEDKFTFYIQRNKNTILLGAFKKMLNLKKLELIYDKKYNFYYIEPTPKPIIKPDVISPMNMYTIKLNTLYYDDIKLILNQFKDLKHSYIKNTNTIILFCTEKLYKSLYSVISKNDVVSEQFQLKITVVESNINELEERGIQISAYSQKLTGENQHFINLITLPATANKTIFENSINGFTASLNFLDSIGVSKIESSPTVTVQSGKKIYFSSVENIPYLVSSSEVNGASQSNNSQIVYKDVGLIVDLLPTLIDEIVFIDLKFTIEALTGEASQTPSTSKRELRSSFQLKRGQLLVLSGLQSTVTSSSTIGVPILMKIPYIGQMFRYDYETDSKKSLSIMIEIL